MSNKENNRPQDEAPKKYNKSTLVLSVLFTAFAVFAVTLVTSYFYTINQINGMQAHNFDTYTAISNTLSVKK